MANGSIIVNEGKKIILNRSYKLVPDYTIPSKFGIGVENDTPLVADTDLDYKVPLLDGTTNDDGSNAFTGSGGGDNSTDNTTTYKVGGGNSDDTSQNLIANDTSASKVWTIANLATAGTIISGTKPSGLWIYVKDSAALAKFVLSGTCLEIKLGSDSSNYYSLTKEASDLSVGWNWISSASTNVEDLTETGTVSGDIDTLVIEITTNNATDVFVAGDVLFDLLRQWESSDVYKSYQSGYPSLNETNLEVESRCQILTTEANGFDINGFALFNTDSSRKMHSEDTFTAESKSSTDQFTIICVDRII